EFDCGEQLGQGAPTEPHVECRVGGHHPTGGIKHGVCRGFGVRIPVCHGLGYALVSLCYGMILSATCELSRASISPPGVITKKIAATLFSLHHGMPRWSPITSSAVAQASVSIARSAMTVTPATWWCTGRAVCGSMTCE